MLNPFGMLYNEITASSLVKVDMQGNVVEAGTTNFGVNVAGFMLHSAIHSARPDIKCIIHVHTPAIVAVSKTYIYNYASGARLISYQKSFISALILDFSLFLGLGHEMWSIVSKSRIMPAGRSFIPFV